MFKIFNANFLIYDAIKVILGKDKFVEKEKNPVKNESISELIRGNSKNLSKSRIIFNKSLDYHFEFYGENTILNRRNNCLKSDESNDLSSNMINIHVRASFKPNIIHDHKNQIKWYYYFMPISCLKNREKMGICIYYTEY